MFRTGLKALFLASLLGLLPQISQAQYSSVRIYSIDGRPTLNQVVPIYVNPGQRVSLAADVFNQDWYGNIGPSAWYDVEDFVWVTDQGDSCDPGRDNQWFASYDCLRHGNFDATQYGVDYYVPWNMGRDVVITARSKYSNQGDSVRLVNMYGYGYRPIVHIDPDYYDNDQFDFYLALGVHGRVVYINGKRFWKPYAHSPHWVPYQYGDMVWDPHYGWTWVGTDPWSVYTDHYGYWVNDPWNGWVWTFDDDYTYRPHRVTFFYHGDYIGWHPHHHHNHVWFEFGSHNYFYFGITMVHHHHFGKKHLHQYHCNDNGLVSLAYSGAKGSRSGGLHPFSNDRNASYQRVASRIGEGEIQRTSVVTKRMGNREIKLDQRSIETSRQTSRQRKDEVSLLQKQNVRLGSSVARGQNGVEVQDISRNGRGIGTPAVLRNAEGRDVVQAPRSRVGTEVDSRAGGGQMRERIQQRNQELERANPRGKRGQENPGTSTRGGTPGNGGGQVGGRGSETPSVPTPRRGGVTPPSSGGDPGEVPAPRRGGVTPPANGGNQGEAPSVPTPRTPRTGPNGPSRGGTTQPPANTGGQGQGRGEAKPKERGQGNPPANSGGQDRGSNPGAGARPAAPAAPANPGGRPAAPTGKPKPRG